MDVNIEMIPSYKIAYIRRKGPYGSDNVPIMEQLKNWAIEKNLLCEASIILGIAQDNPEFTAPKDCRYDVGLVVLDKFKVDNNYINFGEIIPGKYCVFKINHTAEAMKKAWLDMFSELSKRSYEIDNKRPIIERYSMKLINKHCCEICVPIL